MSLSLALCLLVPAARLTVVPPPARADEAPLASSARVLAERQVTPRLMNEVAQRLLIEAITTLLNEADGGAIGRGLGSDPRAQAAMDRFTIDEPAEIAAIEAERKGLVAVVERGLTLAFSEKQRRELVHFFATPAGRAIVAGESAPAQRQAIDAFLSSRTGRHFQDYMAAVYESEDAVAWCKAVTTRIRERLAPTVQALVEELDSIRRSRP